MKQYIATFFSHFGAVRFQRLCAERGYEAQLAPVPRRLSSSCGTCVLFSAPELDANTLQQLLTPELEHLVLKVSNAANYTLLYSAEE